MRRSLSSIVAILLLVGLVATVPTAALAQSGADASDTVERRPEVAVEPIAGGEGNETNETGDDAPAPGALFAGVVGVQKVTLESDLESRTFERRVAVSTTNRSRAAVVAEQFGDISARLETLRDRRRALERGRENGTISETAYRARAVTVSAEIDTVARLAERTEDVSGELPEETLAEKGVNATAVRLLAVDAQNMSGVEVADRARSIADPPAHDRPDSGRVDPPNRDAAANASPDEERGPPWDRLFDDRSGDERERPTDGPGSGARNASDDGDRDGPPDHARPDERAGGPDGADGDGTDDDEADDGADEEDDETDETTEERDRRGPPDHAAGPADDEVDDGEGEADADEENDETGEEEDDRERNRSGRDGADRPNNRSNADRDDGSNADRGTRDDQNSAGPGDHDWWVIDRGNGDDEPGAEKRPGANPTDDEDESPQSDDGSDRDTGPPDSTNRSDDADRRGDDRRHRTSTPASAETDDRPVQTRHSLRR